MRGIKHDQLLGARMPAWVSSPVHRSIVSALVEARQTAGLTQRDVAARMARPPSFVGKVESIERNLSVLELLEWCSAIGIDAEAILQSAARRAPSADG